MVYVPCASWAAAAAAAVTPRDASGAMDSLLARLDRAFAIAQFAAPSIVMLDDIDAVCPAPTAGSDPLAGAAGGLDDAGFVESRTAFTLRLARLLDECRARRCAIGVWATCTAPSAVDPLLFAHGRLDAPPRAAIPRGVTDTEHRSAALHAALSRAGVDTEGELAEALAARWGVEDAGRLVRAAASKAALRCLSKGEVGSTQRTVIIAADIKEALADGFVVAADHSAARMAPSPGHHPWQRYRQQRQPSSRLLDRSHKRRVVLPQLRRQPTRMQVWITLGLACAQTRH